MSASSAPAQPAAGAPTTGALGLGYVVSLYAQRYAGAGAIYAESHHDVPPLDEGLDYRPAST